MKCLKRGGLLEMLAAREIAAVKSLSGVDSDRYGGLIARMSRDRGNRMGSAVVHGRLRVQAACDVKGPV